MLTSTLVFLVLALHSFVPGFCLHYILRLNTRPFFGSIAVSISLLVLTHLLCRAVDLTFQFWFTFYYISVSALVVVAALRFCQLKHFRRTIASIIISSKTITFLITSALFIIYFVNFGTYTEIPSDYWQHVARVQANILQIEGSDLLGNNESLGKLVSGESPFYQLIALLASSLKINAIEISHGTSLFYGVCFLAAVYFFSFDLARGTFKSVSPRIAVAFISTVVTLLWLGTASFSYVRYYAFAPSIINMILYFSALSIFLDQLQRRTELLPSSLLLIPLFLTMVLIHTQEALFFTLMVTGLSFVVLFRSIFSPNSLRCSKFAIPAMWASGSLLFWVGLVVLAVGYLDINKWGYTPHITDLGDAVGWESGIPIVNPAFRMWDTIGLFGITVLGWYFLNWKTFRRIDYINVGLFVPLVTCLNPAFVWLFLHYGSSTVVWRITYLMPLGIAFGFLIVVTYNELRKTFFSRKSLLSIGLSSVVIMFLLPFTFLEFENRTSRIPTFMNRGYNSGYPLVQDLFQKTEELAKRHSIKHFLTDSVTGFILYAGIRGKIRHWLNREYFPHYAANFETDLIESDFSRYLLIINRRTGEMTDNARLAGHWEKDILQTSRYYPTHLEDFIDSHPKRFELLWENDRISIHLIHDAES